MVAFRTRLRPGRSSCWRRYADGSMTRSEMLARLRAETEAAQPLGPVPHHALGGPKPCPGLRQAMLAKAEREGTGDALPPRWWARNTNRHAGRGSKLRPVPRAGHQAVADAVAMLEALATRKARKAVERGNPWRARAQAVLAAVAGLAVTDQVESVLGTVRRHWWIRLCGLSVTAVQALRLPPVAERALRRWLRCRPYANGAWVALLVSPVVGKDARDRLGMVCAREAWRICGKAVRPAALLRWRGVPPASMRFTSRRRRPWAG